MKDLSKEHLEIIKERLLDLIGEDEEWDEFLDEDEEKGMIGGKNEMRQYIRKHIDKIIK